MTWEEFKYEAEPPEAWGRIRTNIVCPKCGKDVYLRTDIVLTTYPQSFRYECDCGWYGISHREWRK